MSTPAFCLKATVDLVAAHASRTELPPDEFLAEIGRVYQVLAGLAGSQESVNIAITKTCKVNAPWVEPGPPISPLQEAIGRALERVMKQPLEEAVRAVPDSTIRTEGEEVGAGLPAASLLDGAPSPGLLEPKVPIKDSVHRDRIFCLKCGAGMRTLKAHLRIAHGMTPEMYLDAFGLDKDYPLVCLDYSAARSAMARDMGLGQKVRPATPETE